jgi:hypothetical protein
MPEIAPPQEPMVIRMPIVRLVPDGNRVVFEVVGSTVTPPGSYNGLYLGPNGYVTSKQDAIDVRGPAGGSASGTPGPMGSPGVDGKSAYTLWLEAGHSGTVNAFLASLVGPQGIQGTIGPKGDTGEAGPKGDKGDVGGLGPKGDQGSAGSQGPKGDTGNTGAQGPIGLTGPQGIKGDKGDKGDTGSTGSTGPQGATGPKGDTGNPANTLLGNYSLGQTAAVAINLGIRDVTVAVPNTVVGERYQAFCRSYRLNGGTLTNGRPAGYCIIDCACNVAGQITVSINAPLLAIGSSYTLNCDIVKINT